MTAQPRGRGGGGCGFRLLLEHGGRALEEAIDVATGRWMGWRIDRRTGREHGIPAGLPYLTGWVAQFEILAEEEPADA